MVTKSKLSFTEPIETRGGSEVKFYEIFDGRYLNGAYYDPCDDVWYPCQWGMSGEYGARKSALDLVNRQPRTDDYPF